MSIDPWDTPMSLASSAPVGACSADRPVMAQAPGEPTGSAVQSASAGAVGGAIAADSWDVRLIDNSGRLALYSATGGSATVEAF